MDQIRDEKLNSENPISTKKTKSNDKGILEKLKNRAEQVGYGSLICEIQVHQGKIRQVDITMVKERMRAD
jgi:hypothetical protein